MILITISPVAGVRDVLVESSSDRDEDAQLAVWPLIREELSRLDARLRREAPLLLDRRVRPA
jgi:hypothetical protein